MISSAAENAMRGLCKVWIPNPLIPVLHGPNGRRCAEREDGTYENPEALIKKADLVKKIAQVKEKLLDNLVVPAIKGIGCQNPKIKLGD